jgi:hypothetical protein
MVLEAIDVWRQLTAISKLPGFHDLERRIDSPRCSALTEVHVAECLARRGTRVELEPHIAGHRPDLRVMGVGGWIYVEVSRRSQPQAMMQTFEALQRLAAAAAVAAPNRHGVITILRTLQQVDLGEIFDWLATQPAAPARLDRTAIFESIESDEGGRIAPEAGDLGPTAWAATFAPNGRGSAGMPVVDLAAERILSAEAQQLPKTVPGVVCLDVSAVPGSVKQWERPLQARLRRGLHSRVSGVVLLRKLYSLNGPEVDGVIITNPRAINPLGAHDLGLLRRIIRPERKRRLVA